MQNNVLHPLQILQQRHYYIKIDSTLTDLQSGVDLKCGWQTRSPARNKMIVYGALAVVWILLLIVCKWSQSGERVEPPKPEEMDMAEGKSAPKKPEAITQTDHPQIQTQPQPQSLPRSQPQSQPEPRNQEEKKVKSLGPMDFAPGISTPAWSWAPIQPTVRARKEENSSHQERRAEAIKKTLMEVRRNLRRARQAEPERSRPADQQPRDQHPRDHHTFQFAEVVRFRPKSLEQPQNLLPHVVTPLVEAQPPVNTTFSSQEQESKKKPVKCPLSLKDHQERATSKIRDQERELRFWNDRWILFAGSEQANSINNRPIDPTAPAPAPSANTFQQAAVINQFPPRQQQPQTNPLNVTQLPQTQPQKQAPVQRPMPEATRNNHSQMVEEFHETNINGADFQNMSDAEFITWCRQQGITQEQAIVKLERLRDRSNGRNATQPQQQRRLTSSSTKSKKDNTTKTKDQNYQQLHKRLQNQANMAERQYTSFPAAYSMTAQVPPPELQQLIAGCQPIPQARGVSSTAPSANVKKEVVYMEEEDPELQAGVIIEEVPLQKNAAKRVPRQAHTVPSEGLPSARKSKKSSTKMVIEEPNPKQ